MTKKSAKLDLWKTARRWQRVWKTKKVFEADANTDKPKFFLTFPYPYVNGVPHIGHLYTFMRVESFARYKRMRGFNVLFPQGWHATGAPIDTAARRVKEGDKTQIETLKAMGIPETEIPKFADPLHWIKTFSKAWEKDLKEIGASIDWRRNFITTDLNPRYSKFISWQFRTLKKKGFIEKGSHPVVWCPKENLPVGDHARAEGEGEVPEEMILLKFKAENLVLPAATFRPETVFGVTNVWVHPELEYVEAIVGEERWIVTEPCLAKLQDQKFKIEVVRKFKGKELIGKNCTNPATGSTIPILPATFISPETGTGIVMSVPSHAPYDWIALKELQDQNYPGTSGLKPISLIDTPEEPEHFAVEICKKLGITKSDDPKLEQATNEVYKKEFHKGRLKPITGKYQGLSIQQAKPKIIEDFIKEDKAALMYELVKRVVCRCGARCHVKIVDDQWFIKYSLPEWKQLTMKALEECKLYPEKIRPQFEYVIDWLRDWACTREYGLGTNLPWDKKWKIESLSDSTIYMAYYTIAHLLKKISLGKIDDALFNYVFLGQESEKLKLDKQTADKLRHEFTYWYPVDFRNSGKDLVQNHLAFFLFNHTAIFPEQYWPRGIGVNGYVSIQKMKMSKSKGIFKTVRESIDFFSPDVVRTAILSTGEELFDVDWDPDLAMTIKAKFENWYRFCIDNYSKEEPREHGEEAKEIDKWMEHQLHCCIKDTTAAMEGTLFRTALSRGFFDLQRHLKWYLKRKAGQPNRAIINQVIEVQTKLLAPFAPHICEEIWSKLGHSSLISLEKWPVFDESKINPALEQSETLISTILEDASNILKLAKLAKPQNITFFIAEDWKYALCRRVKELLSSTRNYSELIKVIMAEPEFKQKGGEVAAIVNKLVKDPSKIPAIITHQEAEYQFVLDAVQFLKQQLGCAVEVIKEQESKEAKAKTAMPGKPAILAK